MNDDKRTKDKTIRDDETRQPYRMSIEHRKLFDLKFKQLKARRFNMYRRLARL